NNPNPTLQQNVQNAVNAAVGIDQTRGDVLTVTPLAFNQTELQNAQAAMAEAAQKEQMMSYLHLGALVLGPLLLLIALFFILARRRKPAPTPVVTVTEALGETSLPALVENEPTPAVAVALGKQLKPVAQPIAEDPQRIYIREQIENLGKSN